jgi:hypothetical protein
MEGFPQDNEYSMQQGDLHGGNANLDIFYASQFVQQEVVSFYSQAENSLRFLLERVPVLDNTLTGTVYYDGVEVNTFIPDGVARTDIYNFFRIDGKGLLRMVSLQVDTGFLILTWGENIDKDKVKVIVDYECRYGTER